MGPHGKGRKARHTGSASRDKKLVKTTSFKHVQTKYYMNKEEVAQFILNGRERSQCEIDSPGGD